MLWAFLYRAAPGAELELTPPLDPAEIRAILLDIEGTTTPIDFVFKTLFPFANAHAEDFLRRHFRETEASRLITQLREASELDGANGAPGWTEGGNEQIIVSAARYVRWLIARDSKINPLKTLQGKIWQEGFRSGELKGEVYPDVAPAFVRWKSRGLRIAIFSSGSVLAQRLLFAHSTSGDLSSFLEAYFDTAIGLKREAASYQKISSALQLPPAQVLFISDVVGELRAAQDANMRTVLACRPGAAPAPDWPGSVIASFTALFP